MSHNTAGTVREHHGIPDDGRKRGPLGRILLFLRQVVAELRKVITPTRSELLNYVVVVLVFVAFMMTVISLLDLAFGQLALWVFGSGGEGEA